MRGWVPHDEGAFGQMGERTLRGELPHRDFDEIYTGGLSLLHGLALRVYGIDVSVFRYLLYVFFLAWLPATYYIATRFVPPLAAGAVVLLCITWSVPNYSAAVPSWYNLFFATFGMSAMLRFIERGGRVWLFVAGICGGLSFLAKLSGLFFVAAVFLFLLFRQQSEMRAHGGLPQRWLSPVMGAAVLASCLGLLYLVRGSLSWNVFLHFVAPTAALGIVLLWSEREVRGMRSAPRVRNLLRLAWPFVVGLGLPVAAFLVPYVLSGSVDAWIRGVFVTPARRVVFAVQDPPPLLATLIASLLWGIVALLLLTRAGRSVMVNLVVVCEAAVLIWSSLYSPLTYQLIWYFLAAAIPFVVVAACAAMLTSKAECHKRQQLFLVGSVLALCSLVQYPFSAQIYFCYVAPLLLLTVTAATSHYRRPNSLPAGILAAALLLFAVLVLSPGFIYNLGRFYRPEADDTPLHLPRASQLRSERETVRKYQELVAAVQRAAVGPYIYAAPDCPEVYFLTGFRNPTRQVFEFLDERSDDPQLVLQLLEKRGVNAIVLNISPAFTRNFSNALRSELRSRYPRARTIGNFEVRWKE